jgi:hypothetical protein
MSLPHQILPKLFLFVLSKAWADVVDPRGRVAVWLIMYLKIPPVPMTMHAAGLVT